MSKLKIDDFVVKINKMEKNLKDLSPVMKKISIDMKSQTKLNFRKQQTPQGKSWKKSERGGQTLRKTSALMHSIANGYGGNFAVVGTNKLYARIHQNGGVIKPKRGKYLTIPIAPGAKKRSAREFDDLFTLRIDSDLYLVRNKGKDDIEFMYKLVKSVVIPKRSYIGINRKMIERYEKWLQEYTIGE